MTCWQRGEGICHGQSAHARDIHTRLRLVPAAGGALGRGRPGLALMEPPFLSRPLPSRRTSTSSVTRQLWNTLEASTTMQRKAMVAPGPTPPVPETSAWAPGGLGPPAAAFLHGLWEQRGPSSPPCGPQQPPWHRPPPSNTCHIPHFLLIPKRDSGVGGWGDGKQTGVLPRTRGGRGL